MSFLTFDVCGYTYISSIFTLSCCRAQEEHHCQVGNVSKNDRSSSLSLGQNLQQESSSSVDEGIVLAIQQDDILSSSFHESSSAPEKQDEETSNLDDDATNVKVHPNGLPDNDTTMSTGIQSPSVSES